MTSVEEADPISEEHVLPPKEVANHIILEHAYSEDQEKRSLFATPEIASPSSTSNDETIEENVADSIVPAETEPEPEPEPPEPKSEQVQEKVKSRELKSLLDAAKESNLDTNIVHKRRSIEPNHNSQESGGKRAMRSQNPEFVARHKKFLHKVNKFEMTADGDQDVSTQETKPEKDGSPLPKTPKRKKESFDDDSVGGSSVEDVKKSRKSLKLDMLNINMKKDKDSFCWRCHRDGILIQCETCPRGFHPRCLKQPVHKPDRWPCPECLAILQAESTKTRSPAMRDMSLEHLCELLKYAAKRMINCSGSEPFIHPVDVNTFPDYQNYVVQPMDLTTLQNNIRSNVYGSTVAFMADAKWILHNSIIFNSYQSKLTSAAKSIVKVCKQEMTEIETCAECYQNANTKKNSWFVEVCSKPHILLWAKLKGFPYWPAKAMTTNAAGLVDVRFFGAHDRAWIPVKECFLFSKKDPNTSNKARHNIAECLKEVNIHIDKLKQIFGEFYHAPYRTPYDPATELEQLSFMLPKYVPNKKLPVSLVKSENGEEKGKFPKRRKTVDSRPHRSKSRSRSRASSCSRISSDTEITPNSKTSSTSDEKSTLKISPEDFDKFMEGYGTEEDEPMLLNNEVRKKIIAYDSESDDDASLKDISDNIKNGNSEHGDEDEDNTDQTILNRGKVRTRGGYHNVTGKVKIISSRKRSLNPSPVASSPVKLSRRNSDISTKSDSSRISGLSDRINRVEDFSDTLEVSFQSKDGISSSSNSSPDKKSRPELVSNKADLGKLKPVIQVNTGDLYSKNKELRISPQNKSSIAERLMKKISESEVSSDVEKIESVKKKILDSLEASSSKENLQDNEDVSSSDMKTLKTETIASKDKNGESNKETSKDIEKESVSSDKNIDNSDKNQSVSSSTETISGEREALIETNDTDKETKKIEAKTVDSSRKSTETEEIKQKHNENVVKKVERDKNVPQESSSTGESEEKLEKVVEPSSSQLEEQTKNKVNKEEKILETKSGKNEQLSKNKLETEKVVSKTDNEKEISKMKPEQNKESNKESPQKNSIEEKETISSKKEIKVQENAMTRRSRTPRKIYDDMYETDDEEESETSEDEEEEYSDEDSLPLSNNKINKTQVKIVNVSDIISGKVNNSSTETSEKKLASSTTKPKPPEPTNILTESIDIKSEPPSEDENEISTNLNKNSEKSRFDVTLTMLDKQKSNISTPKTTSGFKITDNMSRIIDSVATNFSKDFEKLSKSSPASLNKKEITLKPISKLIMSPKQRARKSFPNSPHKMQVPTPTKKIISEKKETKPSSVSVKVVSSLQSVSSQSSSTSTATTIPTSTTVVNATKENVVYLTSQKTTSVNNMSLLPPNQPITLTQSIGKPILAMVHSNPSVNTPNLIIQNLTTSQNSAPSSTQSTFASTSLSTSTSTTSLFVQPQATEQISQTMLNDASLPESISKAVGDLLCKPPPKLKPRPPGPLSNYFEEGSPSSAGPTTNLINSISHRLTDYFRGLLKETLNDLTSIGDPESKIRSLELELETVKHKHAEEMLELRKNISSILKDIQKSIVEEKAKLVDETKAACEAERMRCVEEAKSKQWCAFCFKEAQFYCCWNTSYCDYPCQQKHWATHMKTCSQTSTRNLPPGSAVITTTANTVTKPKQTYSNPNKTVLKSARMIVKQTNKQGVPMYVPVQRPLQGGQQTITLVESTPGNFEIVGNHGGPISLGGKLVPTTTIKVKPANLMNASSAATNTTSTTVSMPQKTIIVSGKQQQLANKPPNENKT